MSWDGSVGDHSGWCCLSSAPRGLRYVSPRRNSHHPSPATRPITTAAVRTGRRRRTARRGCVGRTSMPSRFSRRPIVPGCASAPRRATGSPRSRTSTVSPAMSRASWTRPVVRARWADANGPEARRRRPARRLERSTTIRSPVPRMSMSSPSTANWRSARTSRGRAMSVAGGLSAPALQGPDQLPGETQAGDEKVEGAFRGGRYGSACPRRSSPVGRQGPPRLSERPQRCQSVDVQRSAPAGADDVSRGVCTPPPRRHGSGSALGTGLRFVVFRPNL